MAPGAHNLPPLVLDHEGKAIGSGRFAPFAHPTLLALGATTSFEEHLGAVIDAEVELGPRIAPEASHSFERLETVGHELLKAAPSRRILRAPRRRVQSRSSI